MTHQDALVNYALEVLRLPAPVIEPPGLIEEELGIENVGEGVDEAIAIELGRSDPDEIAINGNPVDWTTQLIVSCFARRDERTAAGRRSRSLHARVHERLVADPTFGGRLMHLSAPSLAFESRVLDTRLGATTAVYTLRHRTPYQSMEA